MFASFLAHRMSLIGSDKRSMIGSVVAIAGVALAVCTMMLTIAVTRGFGNEITSRLLTFEAPLTVTAQNYIDQGAKIAITPDIKKIINDVFPDVENVPVWQTPAMIKSPNGFDGLIIKNLTGKNHREMIEKSIIRGNIPKNKGEILLSTQTAIALETDTASKIDIAMFADGTVKLRRATVAGIYNTHFVEYDKNIAFIDSATLIGSLKAENGNYASGIEIFVDGNPNDFSEKAIKLQRALSKASFSGQLPEYYRVENFTEKASPYLNWLALLNVNVMVIIGLMAFIAAFTLTSSMIVIVLERVKTIGVLKSLGASNRQLRSVFIVLGSRLLLSGIAIADIISVVVITLQHTFHILPLNPQNYYLDYVPVDLTWQIFLAVNALALILGTLTMLIPVKIIASVQPVQAISFE